MTTERNEIVIEGSNDKENWYEYKLPYKPQDLNEAPKTIEPFQPRLDWQMWFASLSNYQQNQWYINLMIRLLQGSEDVTKLFANNPFPNTPPKFIRGAFYNYKFTSLEERERTGHYWKREYLGLYSPEIGFTIATSSATR
jgi:hypothetical protein